MASHEQKLQHSVAIRERLHRLCVRFHFANFNSVHDVMAQSGAIISGSAALAILQPQEHWREPNDVDFYVPRRGLAQILKFILTHGYDLTVPTLGKGNRSVSTDQAHGNENYPSRIVLKLAHLASDSRVDIIVPLKNVVEEVTNFHSTVVMNYITHYGVVSLYPSWTMNGLGMIVRKEAEKNGCIQKYRDRGYTMVNDLSLLPMGQTSQSLELQAKRSTFDDETLFIPFDDVILTKSLSTFETRAFTWTLGKTCSGGEEEENNRKVE